MVFVISEIGVNWDGDFSLLKEMIQTSKDVGCNAVKLQSFELENVCKHPEAKRLLKSAVSKDNISKINQISKEIGIEWFCTPMYPNAVKLLDPYVKKFKIRTLDGKILLENKESELINNVLDTKKEVIVSAEYPPQNSTYYKNTNIKWMYCVPKYPCKMDEIDFDKIKFFDGFSNHCTDINAPLMAVRNGAKILEIHITSDKKLDYIDNNVSFDYEELRTILESIRS